MTSRKVDGNNKVVDNLVSAASALDPTGASGFILGSIKSILSIRDRAYISKFERFWSAFEENKIEVDEFIKRTEEKKDWQKVGENFLLVMDSFSAFDKCYYYGKVWFAWLERKISTEELLEMTNILQTVSSNILQKMLYDYSTGWDSYCQGRIVSCGIADSKVMDHLHNLNDVTSVGIYRPRELSKIGEKLIQILKKKL